KPGSQDAAAAVPDAAQVATLFRSSAPEELKANGQAVRQSLEALQGIDSFLTSTLGHGRTISFDELQQVLQQIERTLAPFLVDATAQLPLEPGAGAPAVVGKGG